MHVWGRWVDVVIRTKAYETLKPFLSDQLLTCNDYSQIDWLTD